MVLPINNPIHQNDIRHEGKSSHVKMSLVILHVLTEFEF